MKCYVKLLFFLVFSAFGEIGAQSKVCDELIQVGDTFIFRDFIDKSRLPAREHYYVFGNLIFTRRWYYWGDGEYGWAQFRKRGKYAKRNGPSCSFYADGTLKYSTVFEKGKMVGPCRRYYPNRVLESTCERHIKGQQDGIHLDFHENGMVKSKTKWEKGRLRQILRYKDAQGNNLPVGTFKDGNGDWIQYNLAGRPVFIYSYKNGKIVGYAKVGSAEDYEPMMDSEHD